MSVKAISWAFTVPMGGNEKLVLLALADHADDQGTCWPSKKTIAAKAYVSPRTVQRIIIGLEKLNLLEKEDRHDKSGRTTSNQYRLKVEKKFTAKELQWQGDTVTYTRTDMDTSAQPDTTDLSSGVGHIQTMAPETSECLPHILNHHKEPSIEPPETRSALDEDFETFWKAYPPRFNSSKKATKVKYEAAIKRRAKPEDILAGAIAYAKSRGGKPEEYTTMAATWLNQDRWKASVERPREIDPRMAELEKLWNPLFWNIPPGEQVDLFADGDLLVWAERIEKYKLLLKYHRDMGLNPKPLSFRQFFFFKKYLEMDEYDFCQRGTGRSVKQRGIQTSGQKWSV